MTRAGSNHRRSSSTGATRSSASRGSARRSFAFSPSEKGSPLTTRYHLKLAPGDVAPVVLLPGDPGRVPLVASLWDDAREVARNREYVTYTGMYRGVPISCTSTGIGAPSTAIALEELARVGATTFIRIGTAGSIQPHARIGDVAIFDSAARYDGASGLYAPHEYPAVAMEAGVIMVLTRIWGLRGGAVALVVDDVFETTNEQFVPEESFRTDADLVEQLARVGCETVRILAELDAS